ncbi:ABC transporter permease [candidate division KSB1 bacterium]
MNKSHKKLPDIPRIILQIFLYSRFKEGHWGDLIEEYNTIADNNGKLKAYFWIWIFAVRSVPGGAYYNILRSILMFENYLKIAFRNMKRQKVYSIINIAGLSIGIACFLAIFLYVRFETSYDNYHPDADRIYRLTTKRSDLIIPEGQNKYPGTSCLAAPFIKENFGQVENAAILWPRGYRSELLQYKDKKFFESYSMYADQELFKIFNIPVIKGDSRNLLTRPKTAVITKTIAQKYFGNEEPIGATIKMNSVDFEITGVIKDAPGNSHLAYDVIVYLDTENGPERRRSWNTLSYMTYLKVNQNIDIKSFEESLNEALKSKSGQLSEQLEYFLQPVKDIHLHSTFSWEIRPPGNSTNLYIFSIIGIFILVIASVNFINLSTACSGSRAKEVGMRKVIGAKKKQLMYQFLSESLLISFLSIIISTCLILILLPAFRELTGIEFTLYEILNTEVITTLILLTCIIGIVAGIYPGLLLSGFNPVQTLKGISRLGLGKAVTRKCLVIFQFTVSVILIISTLIVYFQLSFMKNANLGFDKEQKLVIDSGFSNSNHISVKNEFLQYHNIKGATVSFQVPGSATLSYLLSLKDNDISFYGNQVDYDFVREYELEIIEGEEFNEKTTGDSSTVWLINETAFKMLEPFFPENFIGKEILLGGGKTRIIGVVKDFHYKGLQYEIGPFLLEPFRPGSWWASRSKLTLTISTQNLPETLEFVEKKWNELKLGDVFSYRFLDDAFMQLYEEEEKVGRIVSTFTAIGLFIAFLGLFGLTLFSAEQRTKEIGIRKILGADVSSIIHLLTKKLIKLVTLGILIAFPFAYFAMDLWLQNFAYRIEIGWLPFVASAALAIVLSIFTVSFHAIKAAHSNPVDSLKYE